MKIASATTTAGCNRQVYEGRADLTSASGITRTGLIENKSGKIVSRAKSKRAKEQFKGGPIHKWGLANRRACEELHQRFQIAKKSEPELYKLTRHIYLQM